MKRQNDMSIFDWTSPDALRTFDSVDHQAIYKKVMHECGGSSCNSQTKEKR